MHRHLASISACGLALLVALPIEPRDFVVRPRRVQKGEQLVDRRGAHLTALSTIHHEPNRTIEHRHLEFGERPRELFRQLEPRHANRRPIHFFDVVLDFHVAIAHAHA